ncbi:MAG: DUF2442 domain-containing protein [Candidatus Edwardsbacteria bacterium]|nr:DUF2442 domain-containing protein [Candidatus Edwardsbacteria bacterium]
MILHVKEARYVCDYMIWVRFNNGAEGEVDLSDELVGKVFGPLKNREMFKAFRVNPILETVVWPNDADFAPEFLYDKMKQQQHAGCKPARKSMTIAVRERHGTYGGVKSAGKSRRGSE